MTDEKFFAWLDGELTPAEAADVEAQVSADPALARKADEHRALRARLETAFGSVVAAPVPARIRDFDGPEAKVVDFAAHRQRKAWKVGSPPVQWAAVAASLIVGVMIGTSAVHQPEAGPVETRGGQLYAAAALDEALDSRLASAPVGETRMALTFRDQDGRICRSFATAGSSGLACRDGEDWRIRGLFAAPEGQQTDYRMAAGADPNLAALVESEISGEPFDPEQEAAAREAGWR